MTELVSFLPPILHKHFQQCSTKTDGYMHSGKWKRVGKFGQQGKQVASFVKQQIPGVLNKQTYPKYASICYTLFIAFSVCQIF